MKKLIDFIKRMFVKYRELIVYAVFGVLTTCVNYGTYVLFTRVFSVPIDPSNIIGNVVSILFAYVTNRIFVFHSQTTGKALVLEMLSFFGARAFSFFLDVAIVFVFATKLQFNDLIVKLVSNVIVIVLNYVLSKLLIFRKKKIEEKKSNDTNEQEEKEEETK